MMIRSRDGSATRLARRTRAELERLDAELAMHDERYYNDAMPTIDDAEYDGLRARYEAIERAHPAAAGGARPRVGATPATRADRVDFARGADAIVG